MFEKIPYGVKVRVKGSDDTGYICQVAICCNRFLPFIDMWTDLVHFERGVKITRFETLGEAQDVALAEYNSWIKYYKNKEAEAKERKKARNKVVWEHP